MKAVSPTGNRRGWCGVECLVDQDDQHIMLREGFTERSCCAFVFCPKAEYLPCGSQSKVKIIGILEEIDSID